MTAVLQGPAVRSALMRRYDAHMIEETPIEPPAPSAERLTGWRAAAELIRQRSWPERLVGLAESVPWQAITALVAVLFVVLRAIYTLFYSRFGVAPEEVGLGYGQSLAQAAIGGILITLLPLAVLVALQLAYLAWLWSHVRLKRKALAHGWTRFLAAARADPQTNPRTNRRTLSRWLAHRLAILAVFVGALVVARRAEGGTRWAVVVGVGLTLGWLFEIGETVPNPFRYKATGGPGEGQTQPAREEAAEGRLDHGPAGTVAATPTPPVAPNGASEAVAWGFRWSLAAAVALLLFLLASWAIRDAAAVQAGRPINVGPSVPWQAQQALISWTAATPPKVVAELEGHCVMYLGQANAITVLYDVDAARTLRLPSGSVAVSTPDPTGQESARCPDTR